MGSLLRAIGPEPMDEAFTAEQRASASTLAAAVKKVIMDQRALAGVGNIYANEALFAAGIDPSKPARRLTPASTSGCTGRSAASWASDRLQRHHLPGLPHRHRRAGQLPARALRLRARGEPCRRCGTRLTGTHAIDARITVFCHRCQS